MASDIWQHDSINNIYLFLLKNFVHCRYLIDIRWFKQWKKYVGFEEWETSMVGDSSANPGPIDNLGLFKGILSFLLLNWKSN